MFRNSKQFSIFAVFLADKKAEDHTGLEDKMSFWPLSGSLQVRAEVQKRSSEQSWSHPLPVVFFSGE